MRKITYLVILAALLSDFNGMAQKKTTSGKDTRPNIVVILADDLGYSDLGAYGGEIQTPNIDFLANQGLKFKNFYNTSRCCPTRAALLTGLYNHEAGIGQMTAKTQKPGYLGRLTDHAVTLAEVLKASGYHTAMSGKWHVSNTSEQKDPAAQLNWLNHQETHPYFSPIDQYPTNRGFERYFGTIWGVIDFFDPFSLVSGTKAITSVPKNYYHTDAISDTAATYIREFAKDDKPFFIYVAQNAPHWPLQAMPEDIEKYKDTYKVGWDAIRENRYKRMVELGIIDPKTTALSPRLNAQTNWENNPDKDWDAHAMAVHAAMVDRMDQGVGRIIKALKETGKLDNTLIVFLSDNGASPENSAAYGPGFDRSSQTRAGDPVSYDLKKTVLPGPENTYFSIGPDWANVANTPYKLAKAESYEGGTRTPLIAFWPNQIKNKGGQTDHVGHVMDFMATFTELAKASYPKEYKGNEITPMQGVSFASTLKNKKGPVHDALFNEHFGARSVRYQGWKLVATAKERNNWHLYHIEEDQSEINDLAAQYPEKVKTMNDLWQQWAETHKVFPKP
ncbi:sulfatase-like hydrolase/transferase [Pedobacter sp. BAL39]|uniref:sulfatase-like hydrolase/transferase n=1 Tax=Pedobacter sp. BAL39 TaxID=391596 RepID=UPI000586F41E|nr:sulfatase-like hydrolase/transferase [Pedobacter sp. BAL39]